MQPARRLRIDTALGRIRTPRAGAVAERVVPIFRNVQVGHVVPMNEQCPRSVLRNPIGSCYAKRPPRRLGRRATFLAVRLACGRVRSPTMRDNARRVDARAARASPRISPGVEETLPNRMGKHGDQAGRPPERGAGQAVRTGQDLAWRRHYVADLPQAFDRALHPGIRQPRRQTR